MAPEQQVFRGSSSQLLNAGVYLFCGALAVVILAVSLATAAVVAAGLVVPLAMAAWSWISLNCRVYEVTTERVKVISGVFTRKTDDIELYRVKDSTLVEPFLLRLFSLGNIVLDTNDANAPRLVLEGLKGAGALREELRKHVETCRDRKRTRVAEIE